MALPVKMAIRANNKFLLRIALLAVIALLVVLVWPRRATEEWQSYGANKANWKYSSLSQITQNNVSQLRIAWRWRPPDESILKDHPKLRTWKFEGTPIIVGRVLFVCTPLNQIAAIDSNTGKTIWVFDPHAYSNGMPVNFGFDQRGVTYWTDGKEARIIAGTVDGYLIALDARTGKLISSFGESGSLDLTRGLGRAVTRSLYGVNSPPIICRNVIVVGSTVMDSPVPTPTPPGDVRGYDVRSGKLLWSFHTVPYPGEYGSATWSAGAGDVGAANVWAPMSADESLGYVYLPVSSPSGDFYGGSRPGDGLFGDSLLCLDASTGKRVWHFQLVHHDLWDRDPPAAPIITPKAVVQVTKQGYLYAFDRITGKPLWPIPERPVPQLGLPGEHASPTQPIPSRPPAFDLQGLSTKDLIDFTPALNREARSLLMQFDYGSLFSPPTEKGVILNPGFRGGASWAGASYDPETNHIFIPSITAPSVVQLYTEQGGQSPTPSFRASMRSVLTLSNGLPITKPPYGRVTTINLDTGDQVWTEPMGNGPINHPALRDLHLQRLGWPYRGFPLATKTLLFIAQEGDMIQPLYRPNGQDGIFADVEPNVQVFDKKSGHLITEIPLPSNASGSPMTYMAAGKQFIVIATGGANLPSELVALSLR